jgi:hypothetical protein
MTASPQAKEGAMTEPREVAEATEQVIDGVYHWRINNSNIGGAVSSSHAVSADGEVVLIDPVRLADDALESLGSPVAVVLTARCHQRAAWRYRKQFGADVWLPEDAAPADEAPDRRYAEGDTLPGGLVAIRTPGPEWPHYSLRLDQGAGVFFVSDLIGHDGAGTLHFVPPQYHEDPAATRHSTEKLLDEPFAVLCFDHGAPLADDPKGALRRLLDTVD